MTNIQEILANGFGIEASKIKKLAGYANRNYYVESFNDQYILKEYSFDQEILDFSKDESDLLELLSHKLPSKFQKPVKSVNDNYLLIKKGTGKFYRLIHYIKGSLLADVEHNAKLFNDFGELLAKMNTVLFNQRYLSIMSRRFDWDILQFDLNIKNVQHITKTTDRNLVEYFYLQFNEIVKPLLPELRYSIIHSDANDLNVLVKDTKIAGIIDFGDSVYSLLINELAVAITYAVFGKEDPIKWALPIIKGYSKILPITKKETDILYYLIAARLSISVCHSACGKKVDPENKYLTISEKPILMLLRKWITISPIKAAEEFRIAAGLPKKTQNATANDIDKRWGFLSKAFSIIYDEPIKMEKAAFQYMYDNHGNTYLDLRNNIPHVGHCHPRVVTAGQKAMAKLNTNTRYLYDEINNYSEKLLTKFPISLSKVFYVNSGSAASDLAIRLAKAHTNKKTMMVMAHGYHGNSAATIDISHYKFSGKGGNGIPENTLVAPIPDSSLKLSKPEKETINTNKIRNYLNSIQDKKGTIAGFIAEPIVSAAGQIVLEKSYLQEAYSFIRNQGGICISDEVQTGFGRLGKHFWGYEYTDVLPDIVILGKPIGNGHPMAAVVCTAEIAESFNNGMEFFTSFGGNPVSCAIGEAVLDTIDNEGLAENADIVGKYLVKQFQQLRKSSNYIGEIRGIGLALGVEIVKNHETQEPNTELATKLINELKNKNILIGTDGPNENVFKLKPPLCFSKENAEKLIEELKKILVETN